MELSFKQEGDTKHQTDRSGSARPKDSSRFSLGYHQPVSEAEGLDYIRAGVSSWLLLDSEQHRRNVHVVRTETAEPRPSVGPTRKVWVRVSLSDGAELDFGLQIKGSPEQ